MLTSRKSFELFDNLSVALLEVGADGSVGRANAAAARLLAGSGCSGLIVGEPLADVLGLEGAGHAAALAELWDGSRPALQLPVRLAGAGAQRPAVTARCQVVPAGLGAQRYLLVELVSELTTGGHAESELLATLLADTPTPIYVKDLQGRFMYVNAECSAAMGFVPDGIKPGTSVYAATSEQAADAFNANDQIVAATGEVMSFAEQLPVHGDGEDRHYMSIKFPIRGGSDEVVAVGGVSFDVTDIFRQRRELEASQELLQDVFRASRLGVVVLRPTGNGAETEVVECNEAYAELTGRSRAQVIGTDCEQLVHTDDRGTRRWLLEEMAQGRYPVVEARYLRPDGSSVWCMAVPGTARGADGEQLYVVQLLDITERREFERQLRYHAEHDSLTGLLSRRRFAEILEIEVERSRSEGLNATVLLLDLDGFKDVNDAHGHSTGDELLRTLSGALSEVLRDGDRLARLGGDEFAVMLPGTGTEAGFAIAERLVAIVAEHGYVSDHIGRSEVTASVGATVWGPGDDVDADTLLAEADIAMYDAKESGKNRAVLFDRNLARRQRIAQRSDRVARLRHVIAHGGFVLHGQPVVPLRDLKAAPFHYELLVRKFAVDGELRMPDEFLPEAQRYGLIGQVDDWVIREAVRLVHGRHAAGRPISASVNLSVDTILDPKTPGKIGRLLRDSGVPPHLLTFEFTEAGAISDLAVAADLSRHLRSLGCRVALDDFGSAFATLKYLKHIEFDQLKIDGDFIRRLPVSRTDQVIVKGVAQIAAGFGVEIVAEYVEDQETVDLLCSFGVHFGQGYFLGRPEPLIQ